MSDSPTALDLYQLLPALYHLRDAEQGYPLRALLSLINREIDILKRDMDGLYDDFFVETAAEWVLPYIGDLLGVTPIQPAAQRQRADIANTIYYRRRKGVLVMLEELAADVTGWAARAVAFFELLDWTQNLNHLRYENAANPNHRNPNAVDRVGSVNLRSLSVLQELDGPFDRIAHTVDVRPMTRNQGWHNIRKVGFFLWRLQSYTLDGVPPRQAAPPHDYGYHVSPLGAPAPLFNHPQRQTQEAAQAQRIHTPDAILPAAFAFDLQRYRQTPASARPDHSDYYGPNQSLYILRDGQPVPPEDIVCMDLAHWAQPPAGKVAVDARRGRLAFHPSEKPQQALVRYAYGFSGDLGGGPYDRRESLADESQAELVIQVSGQGPVVSLQQALNQWVAAGRPRGLIRILDNRVYEGGLAIDLPAEGWLVLEAANGMRPMLRLTPELTVTGPASDAEARFILDGFLCEGALSLTGNVDARIQHCTLTPGRALDEEGRPRFPDRESLLARAHNGRPGVTLIKSIAGPLRIDADCRPLILRDSIVGLARREGDAPPAIAGTAGAATPGPAAIIERCTLFGPAFLQELMLASEVIFTEPATVLRRQTGCVRFSFVPPDSLTPRRFRCQPDLALAAAATPEERAAALARILPEFTSEHYGDPGYAQLRTTCAEEIRMGAENGAEMGAFAFLMQPQRETNLRLRLEEYLPFGLEAGLVYVT